MIACRPAGNRLIEAQRRITRRRFLSQSSESRRLDGAMHGHLTQAFDAGADLPRIDVPVDRLIRNDDFGFHSWGNWTIGGTDFETPAFHHSQIGSLQTCIGIGCESQRSVYL